MLHRLQEASVRGRTVFVVDHYGHLVVHPDLKNFVPGADVSSNSLVKQVMHCRRSCATPKQRVFRRKKKITL